MLVSLRRDRFNLSLPAIQVGLLAFSLRGTSRWETLGTLALLLLTALFGWWRSIRHARLILDTPTSRVASAAQGYVELRGRGQPLAGLPVLSPLNGLPVLWYRLQTFHKQSDGKWRHERTDESEASFLLEDGSGSCAVDPEGAEMLIGRRDVVERGDTRYVQWCLLPHDRLYVLGEFTTLGSVAPDFDSAAQVRDLLADWKRDHKTLLQRFDTDGDGQIDLREWELARAQARREVDARVREVLAAPEAHLLRAPADGRLFLISDLDPGRIGRRYRLWAAFHLAAFLASAAALAWFSSAPLR